MAIELKEDSYRKIDGDEIDKTLMYCAEKCHLTINEKLGAENGHIIVISSFKKGDDLIFAASSNMKLETAKAMLQMVLKTNTLAKFDE